MKTARERLISDALAAGMIVERSDEIVTIRKSRRGVAVRFWQDGKATRADLGIDLSVCRSMNLREARKALEL